MDQLQLLKSLCKPSGGRMVLLVMDGLGDLPDAKTGLTPLEAAATPNLDALAAAGACGQMDPIARGITPGSGPAHLALFGYDPLRFVIGRGLLEALGIGFPVVPGDLCIRVNFCTVDKAGVITDRRAGRIPTETNVKLCEVLRGVKLPGVELHIETVKEHRAAIVLRGEGLYDNVPDTDPQVVGEKPLEPAAGDEQSEKTASLARELLSQARVLLKNEHPANMMLLRGFARYEPLPTFGELYGLNPAAIETYPMYRGVASLAGMAVIGDLSEIPDEFAALERLWGEHDYFFVHIKKTDSYGEDGNYDAKVHVIEEVDRHVPLLSELAPAVLAVTGDHSTPCPLAAHSWHSVPLLLWGEHVRPDGVKTFGERAVMAGGLGRFPTLELLPQMLACAGRLEKFGA